MNEEMMGIPGLISPGERELLRRAAETVCGEVEHQPVIINIGVFLGASCGCLKVGCPSAWLFGVDTNGLEIFDDPQIPEGTLDFLDMTLIQGDSRVTWADFVFGSADLIFVDGCHEYSYVLSDILNWVVPYVRVGGYALFHDAYYTEDSNFYNSTKGVAQALAETLDQSDHWEELEKVDTIRWYRRLR